MLLAKWMEGAGAPGWSIVEAAGALSGVLRPQVDLFHHWRQSCLPHVGRLPGAERLIQELNRAAAPELEPLGGQGQHPVGRQNLHRVQGHVAAVPVPALEHHGDRGGVDHGCAHVAPC